MPSRPLGAVRDSFGLISGYFELLGRAWSYDAYSVNAEWSQETAHLTALARETEE